MLGTLNAGSFRSDDTLCAALRTLKSYLRSIRRLKNGSCIDTRCSRTPIFWSKQSDGAQVVMRFCVSQSHTLMELAHKQMGSLIDGSAIFDPLRDRRRGRRGPDDCSRACTRRQKGDHPRGARSMRWTHLPTVGSGIWLPGGGRRRVRPWRGACDPCLDAGGGTFAGADRGYSMGCPQRRILAERVSACSCGPTAPSLKRVENRFTGR